MRRERPVDETGRGKEPSLAIGFQDEGISATECIEPETMRQLSEELTSTENRVAFARQGFNDAVAHYNTTRESFPGMIFAGAFPAAKSGTSLPVHTPG